MSGAPSYSSQPYPYKNIHGYLRQIFEAFGPERSFWGTDITRMPCSYRQCVTMFTEELPWLKGRDLERVMGGAIVDWLGWKRPAAPLMDVHAALERFAALDEKELAQPWRFRDKPMDVRYALYRTIEDAQEMLVGAVAQPHPESRRILALAQRAFGDLRGLMIGLPTDLLDRSAA